MSDSVSRDGNNNHSFDDGDFFHSTPKRQKLQLTCSFCDKVYSSRFYYEKHLQSHNVDGNVNASVASIHLDVSDLSFSALKGKDDLHEDNQSTKKKNPPTFKKPWAPASKRVPPGKDKNVCTYCLKAYVCTKSFKSHLRTHRMQDAAARFPAMEKILSNIKEISSDALTKVCNAPSLGETGARFRELLGHILSISTSMDWKLFCIAVSKELLKLVMSKKFLLPSALLTGLYDQVENILSNTVMCADFLLILQLPGYFVRDIQSQFLLEFLLKLVHEVFIFISKSVRGPPLKKKMADLDSEDRQVIYYIGGSIMRGYLRIALRFKTNRMWSMIAHTLRTKILQENPTDDQDASWTAAINRGGLLFISSECQEFFITLAEIVFQHEQRDGSIDFDRVIKVVSTSHISVLWDLIILDSLQESTSLRLMNDIVHCFCNTCGRGFAKRRLNALREKPVISMPTRHKVASRKGS